MKNFIATLSFLILSACFSGTPDTPYLWAWISGDSGPNQTGTYGTILTADPANVPGAREQAVTWRDASNNLWLFGGEGYSSASSGTLNDLWKFDGSNWTWMHGNDAINQSGSYVTSVQPGSRRNATSWRDGSGNLWLFGGYGYDSAGSPGLLNDLWRYNIATDTWSYVSGADTVAAATATYGTKGTADAANVPGGREGAISWIDSNGDLWLFGGRSGANYYNDLWKYDVSTGWWTWISGDNISNQAGSYGTQGSAAAANKPGARSDAVAWIDGNNDLWIFGGDGYDESSAGLLNDLWKYDLSVSQWIWVGGSKLIFQPGSYGSLQVASPANIPGARQDASAQIESNGHVWLFGGYGEDKDSSTGYLNDLWRFDGSNWTWISGSAVVNDTGSYGVKGTADAANTPGARQYSASWMNSYAEFWIFGGRNSTGLYNDLWRFQP